VKSKKLIYFQVHKGIEAFLQIPAYSLQYKGQRISQLLSALSDMLQKLKPYTQRG